MHCLPYQCCFTINSQTKGQVKTVILAQRWEDVSVFLLQLSGRYSSFYITAEQPSDSTQSLVTCCNSAYHTMQKYSLIVFTRAEIIIDTSYIFSIT